MAPPLPTRPLVPIQYTPTRASLGPGPGGRTGSARLLSFLDITRVADPLLAAEIVGRSNNGLDGFSHGELSFAPAEAQVAAQHFPGVEIANGDQLSQEALALGARSYCKKRGKHTFHPLAMVGASRVGDQAERRYTLLCASSRKTRSPCSS